MFYFYTFALRALWSHAHRVRTTFALDWSKAREARDKNNNKKLKVLCCKPERIN